MELTRRNVLAGAGLATLGGVTLGSSAFTSVQAERELSITTATDENAQLSIRRETRTSGIPTAPAAEYVNIDGNGLVEISISDVNRRAVSRFSDLLQITNNGIEPVIVGYLSPDLDPTNVELFHEDPAITRAGAASDFPGISGPVDTTSEVLRLDDQGPGNLSNYPVLSVGETLDSIGLQVTAEQGDAALMDGTATLIAATTTDRLQTILGGP